LTVGSTWALTSGINSDLRINWSQTDGDSSNRVDTFGGARPVPEAELFLPPYDRSNSNVSFGFLGGVASGWADGASSHSRQRQLNIVSTVSWVRGAHVMKFGVDYRRLTPVGEPTGYSQSLFFNTVPPSVSGITDLATVRAGRAVDLEFENLSLFAQDGWRATPRLTLTYGLRWDRNPPPSSRAGLRTVTNYEDPRQWGLAPPGTPLWKTTTNNFAPRIGAAYQLSDSVRWGSVLRGGAGIFYDLGTGLTGNATGAWQHAISKSVSAAPIPIRGAASEPTPLGTPPVTFLYVHDPRLRLPRVYHFSVAIEQSVWANQTLTVSYVGAVGRRLLQAAGGLLTNETFRGSYFRIDNSGRSQYKGLQVQFQRRLSQGLQALASYTLSESLDTGSDEYLDQSTFTLVDLTPSDFDIRHTFTAAVTYDLPSPSFGGKIGSQIFGGWSVDAIFRARSATPITVFGATGLLEGRTELSQFRADRVPGVPVYISDPAVPGGTRLNTAAFAAAPLGRHGSSLRNEFRGFGMWQPDLGIRREFRVNRYRQHVREIGAQPPFAKVGSPMLAEMSPALNAYRASAPVLMEYRDRNVVGLEFYAALRSQGKPVELVFYPHDGHVLQRPKARLASMVRNLDWFDFWLVNKEDPDPAKHEQYARWRELRRLQEGSERTS
jgi:hypothetical protein